MSGHYFYVVKKNCIIHYIMNSFSEIIQHFYPNKILTRRVSDLITQISQISNNESYISIAIEKIDGSRQFCYLTLDEFISIYHQCPLNERSIYELIFPTNTVKTYIDFEYYIDQNLDIQDHHIGMICCLKIFYYILNFSNNIPSENWNFIHTILNQFLVLEA